jgi:aryl-alcohol dehydrogenase-like predicted oxidoreductase
VSAAGTIRLGDLVVDRMGYGAMRITGPGIWGPPADPDGAVDVLRRAVELGVDFIDTADSYGPNVSEELIATALHPYDGIVVATKGGLTRSGPDRWERNGRPEHLREALEGSLRRLRVERIDLYQLHRIDPQVPLEVSLGVLAEAQAAGRIRHIGLSNVSVAELDAAREIVEIVSVQNRYSVLDREDEDVVAACEQRGIAYIPWFPLAAGRAGAGVEALERVAAAHAATPGQVALAWLLARSPQIVPIPGTSRRAHLEENVAAAELALSEQELAELDHAAG